MTIITFWSGFGILLFQCYKYLKNGFWESISIMDSLKMLNIDTKFIEYPKDWIGFFGLIESFFDFMPISLFLIALSVGFLIGSSDE